MIIILVLPTSAATPATDPPGIELEDCVIIGGQDYIRRRARCGLLSRPENPADPDGASIELKIAVIESFSPEPRPDAFTVINGGPGGSSISLYVDGAGAFAGILRERDIVVIDQRGTGASNPQACEQLQDVTSDISLDTSNPAAIAESVDNCLESLTGDPRYYTTSVAVADLDAVREALGYEQLNLYGVSYGTRVAQHYARRYPDRVRTLTIDGVVPAPLALGPNAALNGQRTLDRLFARCAEDADCASAFPGLADQFAALQKRFRHGPISVTLANPVTGKPETNELLYEHFAVTIRMMAYAPETTSLIPFMIDQAYHHDNYTPIAANASRILNSLANSLNVGMHNSVICTEDVPYLEDIAWDTLGATYMGADHLEALQAICGRWPIGVIDDDIRIPLVTDTPVLLLSGVEDPITPPEYATEVAKLLPNSRHLEATGQGHGIFNRGCLPTVLTRFVETADLQALEADCVSRLTHQPFFLNSMGPRP